MNYFFFMLLFAFTAKAQNLSFEDIENAPASFDSIEISGDEAFDIIDALSTQRETVKRARTRFIDTSIDTKKKSDRPAPYLAVVGAGSVVTRLSDDKDFYLPRRIQVLAQLTYPGSPITLLLDKNAQEQYATKTFHVVSIEDDLKLTPSIDPKMTYVQGKNAALKTYDHELKIRTDLSWEFERLSADFWSQAFAQDFESFSGSRVTLKSFYLSPTIPFHIGLALSYQSANVENDFFTVDWSALFIGPQLSYTLWSDQDTRVEIEAGAAAATFSNARTASYRYSPSAYEWGILGKVAMDTWAGTIFAAAQMRQTHLSLNKATHETSLGSQKDAQTSLSFQLGYRWGLAL